MRRFRAFVLGAGAVLAASLASAQTNPETPPSEHETDQPDHSSHHEHSGGGVGFGISVDIGKLFEDSDKDEGKPKPKPADTGKVQMDTPPPVLADALPTAPKDDPKNGIPVTGGTVHRGTGTYVNPNDPNDKRAAFYLWVDLDANGKCKDCEWYQFANVTITVENHDVTGKLAKGGGIESSIGATTHLGKWDGDWHKKDEEKEKKKKPHIKMPGGKPPVEAGPYAPREIPGSGGKQGLVDAPNWGKTGAWPRLVERLSSSGILHTEAHGGAPPDSEFTMVITTLFRDYLYCIDPPPPQCLGYSDETYTETIKFKVTWAQTSAVELGTSDNATWKANVSVVSDDSSVKFGDWHKCP